ncbi:recombination protein RecT [Streptomyces sp. SAI-208]|uniref:recombinase RecT n=1 Tax=Streptomyces sp. SAI-208 TaxID=2940550 RepID=UPI002475BF47|nr:recombinase RecT [Streptomyces sp. SAI-208]MDH6610242.1 recombination protein RecT [Streptomyces sp. SAI-208]
MSSQTVSTAIEKREQGPAAMVELYRADLELVMPSHLQARVGAWIRSTQGLLRRDPKLMEAAQNDVGQFIAVLMDAGRLGLEPGTEQYYLVPRWNKKKRATEVTGVRGYQGEIELMYRAGAVSSVIVEVVYTKDQFQFRPGRDERPLHDIDWDAEDRGELRLVYAYAVMKDGATSKVVVLNKGHIAKAMAKSDSADKDWSPWRTDTEAMWLKTGAHRLAKWVPTSAEYMREQLRSKAVVDGEQRPEPLPPVVPAPAPGTVDSDYDDSPIEGELVD